MTEAFPNFRVQKLASNGNFITKFSLKLLEDEFSPNPTDIVIDSRGIIYVLDSYNSQIQVFSPNKNNTSDNELDVDDIDLSDKSENTNRTVNESTLLPEIRAGITDQI